MYICNVIKNKETMTTTTQRFIIKEVYKFGMLFGYKVFDTVENVNLPFDFDEDEKHKAEAKAELKNALYN
jgi:hypothetical protein